MIRRPPRSTRTDTLFPLHDALPIYSIKNVTTSAYKGCEQIVLAENSCPNCQGAIQQVHYSGDYIYDPNGIRLPRDYPVCIGKSVPSSQVVDMEVAPMKEGCGWSDRKSTRLNSSH